MKYKVLVLDLDGTLVNKKSKISHENILALSQFIDNGGIVCFATGRSLTSAKKVADNFQQLSSGKMISYLACLNGTLIYDNINNVYLKENIISKGASEAIFLIAKKYHLGFGAYTKQGMIDRTMRIYGYKGITWIINLINKKTKVNYLKELDLDDGIYKINLIRKTSLKKFNEVKKLLLSDYKEHLESSMTSDWLIELTKVNVNKGYAVRYFSELLKINLKEFVCFGDSYNDLSMFKECGLKIALKKKCLELIKNADYFENNSEYNGVAFGLKKYIF